MKKDVDRYPDFIAPAGMTGVIVGFDPDFIRVKMDRPVLGAETWENEVHWFDDWLRDFDSDVEVGKKRGKR